MSNEEKIAFLKKQKPKFNIYRGVYGSIVLPVNSLFIPFLISYFALSSENPAKNVCLVIALSVVGFDIVFPFINYFFIVLPVFRLKNIYLMKEICLKAIPYDQRHPQGFFKVFDVRESTMFLLGLFAFFQLFTNGSGKMGGSLGKKQMLFADGIDVAIEFLGKKSLKDDILQIQLDALFGKSKP